MYDVVVLILSIHVSYNIDFGILLVESIFKLLSKQMRNQFFWMPSTKFQYKITEMISTNLIIGGILVKNVITNQNFYPISKTM